MKSWILASDAPRLKRRTGFVRHESMLLIALVGVTLAVVLPQFLRHGWRKGLLALLVVGLLLLAGVGLLMILVWLLENVGREGEGWQARMLRILGHLLRFILFGFMAAILGVALVAGHRLGVAVEDGASLVSGLLGGLGGCFLHRRLGPSRFWVAFRRFCLALLGSFVGGILGILGPEPWSVGLGILIPLLVFGVLAAFGRIVPPQEGSPPPPE